MNTHTITTTAGAERLCFDTPPRRSRAQRRRSGAPTAPRFVGALLATLMVGGSFSATLLVDSPAMAYEQGGVDQGESDNGFEQGGVGGGEDTPPAVTPPQQTPPSYNYNPGPGVVPAPPREAPYQPYVAPTYNAPTYDTPYTPAPPRAFTLPRQTAPVRPIAPPPEMMRVGNFVMPVEDVKKKVPGVNQAHIDSINEWSAYGEAKIAQGLISVGVPEDEASRQAAATIIGVALGGTAGAAALGIPAAVTGGVGGALIGTAGGAGIGVAVPAPFPGANVGPGAAIGAAAGGALGAAALGIPAAIIGGVAGGTAGGLLAHALGAGDPGANPRQPRLPGQPDPNRRTPQPPRPQPAPLPNPGANQFELHLPADQAAKAGLPAVHYQVNVGGDVNAETTIGGQTYTANWTAEQAEAPYKALGGAADQAKKAVTDATRQATDQLRAAVPGIEVTWPQLSTPGAAPEHR